MIDMILSRAEFSNNPPVLLDIGASGAIHQKWSAIAKYSIGIAFDADLREMDYVVKEKSGFMKLYVYNSIVTDQPLSELEFYLTRSPYCSSLLQPDQTSLNNWEFSELFEIDKTVKLKAVTLSKILQETGVKSIDWFKTDSQGTDLRLFVSLGEKLIKKVLVAEFEPGIIDAYEGEDKLWSLLAYMDKQPFWMNALDIKGVERIGKDICAERLRRIIKSKRDFLPEQVSTSPCWGEVSYFNTFNNDEMLLDKRDYLLGWVFAIIEYQLGFSLELALKGSQLFGDAVFEELADYSIKMISRKHSLLPIRVRKLWYKIQNIFA